MVDTVIRLESPRAVPSFSEWLRVQLEDLRLPDCTLPKRAQTLPSLLFLFTIFHLPPFPYLSGTNGFAPSFMNQSSPRIHVEVQ